MGISKVKRLKSQMGWEKKPEWPECRNCKHFKSDHVILPTGWDAEKNLRCIVGNFKTWRTSTCRQHERRE